DRPDHTLDQYGFQLDGPVYLPKWLKKESKVKLFYMGSFENYYEKWPQFLRNSYPEMDMRQGDFSRLTTPGDSPRQITIYNPFTASFAPNGDPIRAPFANNRIPSAMINPVAAAVSAFMPQPNAVTPGVGYAQQNVLNPEYAAEDRFYNLILKFDWQFGDNHRAFVRHASNDRTEDRCVNGICAGPGQDGQQPFQRINDAYVIDYVGTLSPTTVLNIRASHNRFVEKGLGRANDGFDLTSLGLPASLIGQLPSPADFGRWEFNRYSSMGRGRGLNITNNYNLMANLTKISGAHTMKFGIDLRRIHFIQQNTGNILFFRNQGNWTQRLWNQGEPDAGDSYADFLLGLSRHSQNPNDAMSNSNFPVFPFFRQWYFAPYFQDDWKVNRKLTLNLGLRWDFNQAPDEKHNRINREFDTSVASPIAGQIPASAIAAFPNLANLRGGITFAGVNGQPRIVSQNRWGNFQPRIGVAYSLNEKTVLRGGWGLYFMNPNNDYLNTTGFSTFTPLVQTLDDGRTPIANVLSNPYPNGISQPAGAALGSATFLGRNFNWFDPNFTTPYVHQFSFGFQRQITATSTLEVTYVGSRTIGANDQRDFNVPSPAFRSQCNLLEGGDPNFCNAAIPNPFRGVEAFRGTNFFQANTLSRFQLNRPFPQFDGNLQQRGLNTSKIWYNSLQLNFNQRIGNDLTLLGNYTFSKMVERWGFNDPIGQVSQQGLYFNDRPHYLKFNTVYDLPVGTGKKWGGNMGRVANMLLGGWTFSTYTQFSSGEPNNMPGNVLPLRDPRTTGGDWNGAVDWNRHQVQGWNPCVLRQFNDGRIVPQPFSVARGCGTDTSQYAWLMTADFTPRLTPSRSGQIRKQSLFNMDASVNKNFQVTERLRFQLRGEAFNLTNYYFFGRDSNFETDPNNPNFGTLFPSQAWIGNGYPRQVQIGFKAYW
ncbi:MAG: TonB-dependent receptor, partial [Bryobacterales bacterium]|nr:TonB-dependent receptor [Bryobacterales bacterium]